MIWDAAGAIGEIIGAIAVVIIVLAVASEAAHDSLMLAIVQVVHWLQSRRASSISVVGINRNTNRV